MSKKAVIGPIEVKFQSTRVPKRKRLVQKIHSAVMAWQKKNLLVGWWRVDKTSLVDILEAILKSEGV